MCLSQPSPRRCTLSESTACVLGGGAMRMFGLPGTLLRVARKEWPELSPDGLRRLRMIDWHLANGANVSKTCRHFTISRQTLYRWLKRYNPKDLRSLEDRSSRPRRCKQATWTRAEVLAVKAMRERYPAWGKLKLAVLLSRQGLQLSVSRVGRILAYLKRTRQLIEPLRRFSARRRQWKRQYATRKPRSYEAKLPGDIVQLDTMDVRPEPNIVLKQFTAVDVVSRWSVPTIAGNATATLATKALEAIIERSPFPIRAIQVDGGSEFMAGFEDACRQRGILLFELPPRSPKLNGRVERTNRTYRDEFYNCSNATPTVAGFTPHLRRWEDVYNHLRPHQALGFLTPAEFLSQRFNITPPNGVSPTS